MYFDGLVGAVAAIASAEVLGSIPGSDNVFAFYDQKFLRHGIRIRARLTAISLTLMELTNTTREMWVYY